MPRFLTTKKRVSIVVPAWNEEKNIPRVIKECKKLQNHFPLEIVVVEGGSKDKTAQIAKKSGADKVLSFPYKRGKGADFWIGGALSSGDYIVQIDADLQFQPNEIPLFVKELENGSDVVIGTRFSNGNIEKGSVSFRNLLGNHLVSFISSLGAGEKITDVMAGFKGFRRQAFLALDLKEPHFEYEAEAVVKAYRMGMKVKEIPITYKRRRIGNSGIRAVRDGLRVAMTVLKVRFLTRLETYKTS